MKVYRLIIGLLFLMTSTGIFAQVEKIKYFQNHVRTQLEQINTLANQNKVKEAVDKLQDLNRYMEYEIGFNLTSQYINARKQDPSIDLCMDLKLSPILQASYWSDKYKKFNNSNKLATDALDGIASMRYLDNQDIFWSKLKVVYRVVSTTKDLYENLQSMDLYGLYSDLKDGTDGFIEDYKNAETTMLQSSETDLKEIEMKTLAKKAQLAMDKMEPVLNFMKVNAEQSEWFSRNTKNINKICNDVKQGAFIEMVYGDKDYTWNYGPFQKEVEEECELFIETEYTCKDFEAKFKEINKRAKADWERVKKNIEVSDDKENKAFFMQEVNQVWPEYFSVVSKKFQKAYDQICNQKPPSEQTNVQKDKSSLFAGTGVGGDAEAVEKEEQEKEEQEEEEGGGTGGGGDQPDSTVVVKKPIRKELVDRYWENTIPENASYNYMITGQEIHVKYDVQGRTVGYRNYKNNISTYTSELYDEVPYKEIVTNNCFLNHGPSRQFVRSKSSGDFVVQSLVFYRAGLETGPKASWNRTMENAEPTVSYYIDGKKVSEQEYRNKAKNNKSLAPPDIYLDPVYQEIPFVNHIPKNLFISGEGISWDNLRIPSDAFAKYEFRASSKKTPQQFYGIEEIFYMPDRKNGFKEVGERVWRVNNGVCKLQSETVTLGNKQIFRRWDLQSGTIERITFAVTDYKYTINGTQKGFTRTCAAYDNKKIRYYKDGNTEITKEEYLQLLNTDSKLPPIDLYQRYMENAPSESCLTMCNHPSWLSKPPLDVTIAPDAKIWKGRIGSNGISLEFVSNNMDAGSKSWYDFAMTRKRNLYVKRDNHRIYSISWREDGSLNNASIDGLAERIPISIKWDENGILQENRYPGVDVKTADKWEYITQNIPNIFKPSQISSPRFKQSMPAIKIPDAEMTPLMKEVMIIRELSMDKPEMIVNNNKQEENNNITKPTDDSQQARMEELNVLGGKINDLIIKSDQAFNKNYWENNSVPVTTRQPTNPKKESYNLMRQASQLANSAEYPESKNAFYYILAYKLSEYAGRINSDVGKEEFISLAAQNLEKCASLIPQFNVSKRERAELYAGLAETWREMTRKALWGDHQYNKAYCDQKTIHFYEKAVQTDPTYEKAKKILAQLKTPKKPVPEVLKNEEHIAAEKWVKADAISEIVKEDKFIEPPPDVHPLEVGTIYVSTGSTGTVWIKRAGADDWKKVTNPEIVIFPCDAVKTSKDASGVKIKYTQDKAELTIKSDAIVQFTEDYIVIQRGNVMMQFRKEGQKFVVVTSSSRIGVRGTVFEVNVAPDKTTTTYLYDGVVEIRNDTEITYLTPGEKNTAKPDEDKMQQQTFNAQQRKNTQWKEVQDVYHHNTPTNQGTGNRPAPEITTSFGSYYMNDSQLGSQIDREVNKSKTPVGIQLYGDKLQMLYLNTDVFNMSAWAIDWYTSADEINSGITSKMQNEGYFPMGLTTKGNTFYVLYIKGETNATAWQLVESSQNLQSVSSDISPYITNGYLPVGITLHGDWYYTLLVQVQNSSLKNWEITGYRTKNEMQKAIDERLLQNMVPFGYIEDNGLYNVLYVGY